MKLSRRSGYALLIFSGILILTITEFYYNSIEITIAGLIFSVLGLETGSGIFVDQAVAFGRRFRISGKMVGLIVLSFGASIDELFLSLTAAFEKFGEISVGNIQGSNIITFIVFLVLAPYILRKKGERFITETLMLAVIYSFLVLFTFVFVGSLYVGLVLLSLFAIYVVVSSKDEPRSTPKVDESHFSPLLMIWGFTFLLLASIELVKVVNSFSGYLDLSLFSSGFIFAGVTGSIPELFILGNALRRKESDMSIGVVYGSTLFKATLVLGLSMTITYVSLDPALYTYYAMLVMLGIATAMILLFRYRRQA